MKKSTNLLLGAATVWPFIYMFLFFGAAFFSVFFGRAEPPGLWAVIIPLHLLTMLGIFALLAIYMVNVFRNDRVTKDMKVLWAVVIFMGGMIAMPVYWYLYIWRDTPDPISWPSKRQALGPAAQQCTSETTAGREAEYVPPTQPPDWR